MHYCVRFLQIRSHLLYLMYATWCASVIHTVCHPSPFVYLSLHQVMCAFCTSHSFQQSQGTMYQDTR